MGTIAKIDAAKGLVYGWASIVSEDGQLVEDSQGERRCSSKKLK